MRQRIVLLQFHHLRIDHHEAELVRAEPVHQGGDDGVDAHRFTRTGAASDHHVGHLSQIGDDRMPIDIFAQGQRNPRLRVLPLRGFQKIPHYYLGLDCIGNLDTHRGFTRNRSQDVQPFGLHCRGDVVGQACNLLQFHPGRWM